MHGTAPEHKLSTISAPHCLAIFIDFITIPEEHMQRTKRSLYLLENTVCSQHHVLHLRHGVQVRAFSLCRHMKNTGSQSSRTKCSFDMHYRIYEYTCAHHLISRATSRTHVKNNMFSKYESLGPTACRISVRTLAEHTRHTSRTKMFSHYATSVNIEYMLMPLNVWTHFKNIDVLSVCIMHHRTESRRIFKHVENKYVLHVCSVHINMI